MSNQYLSFQLDKFVFGINLTSIQEVMGQKEITILPGTPDFMKGVINIRGQILPVIDLRIKFDIALSPPTIDSCILIVDVAYDSEQYLVGLIVDSVHDVVELNQELIEFAPEMGNVVDSRFIEGITQIDDEFCTLLNLGTTLSINELLVGANTEPISLEIT